jgi:sialic acid synthase SpsE
MRRVVIIAEIGENHEGDWDRARQMVVDAARAGADVVKLQSYLASDVADDDPEKEWFARVQVPDPLHYELRDLAERCGVRFLSSCFSVERARFLVEGLGLRQVKIASSELLNFPLLDYINGRVDKAFVSTGMATLDEVHRAVSHLTRVPSLCVMQCTSLYPCPPENANLAVIPTLRAAFPSAQIGYSDHTIGTLASIAAVAAGAEVIEKHFTLDKSLPGTDHICSATPEELREIVDAVRRIEVLSGTAVKAPVGQETVNASIARRRFAKAH